MHPNKMELTKNNEKEFKLDLFDPYGTFRVFSFPICFRVSLQRSGYSGEFSMDLEDSIKFRDYLNKQIEVMQNLEVNNDQQNEN